MKTIMNSEKLRLFKEKLNNRFSYSCPIEENFIPPLLLRLIFACIGGSCIFLSFPDFDIWPLAYISLLFFLWSIHGTRPLHAFLLGSLGGFCTNLGGFPWIYDLMKDFGHIPMIPSAILTIAFAILQGTLFGFWTFFVRKVRLPSWCTALLAMPALEFSFPMLFPWYLGNGQYSFTLAIQIADVFGILGVTLLIVLVNCVLYEVSKLCVAKICKKDFRVSKKFLIAGISAILLCFAYSALRIQQIDAIQADAPKLKVGMVEADIDIHDSSNASLFKRNLITHHTFSQNLMAENLDLLVWPESSYASNFIWGSLENSDDTIFLEADSLYTPEFREKVLPSMYLLNNAFGAPVYRNPALNRTFNSAIRKAALKMGYHDVDSGFPLQCERDPKQFMRCPFLRVPHDSMTYYRPGYEWVRPTEQDDLAARADLFNVLAVQRNLRVPLILGSISILDRSGNTENARRMATLPKNKRYLHNIALFLDEDGRVIGNFKKIHLMPIGEYIPYGEKIPWIYDLIPEAGSFTPGNEIKVFDFKGAKLAIIICYEDILPSFVRKFAELEPQIFVNVTNDAWFGKTQEPAQHMALSVFRSVEHRKWLVRSTNTGVSVFVDAAGRVIERSSIYDAEVLSADVAVMPVGRTIYSYIGDILGWLGLLGMTIAMMFMRKPRIKDKKKENKTSNSEGIHNNIEKDSQKDEPFEEIPDVEE